MTSIFKKTLTLGIFLISSFFSIAQIKIRGKVISKTTYEVLDSNVHKEVSTVYPQKALFHLSDEKFFVYGSIKTPTYELFDKDTTTIEGNLVISYMSVIDNEMYLVGAREIPDDRNKIFVAIFPFSNYKNYTEYYLEVISIDKK